MANSICLRMPKLRMSFLLISNCKSFTIFSKSRRDKFKGFYFIYDFWYFSSFYYFYKMRWQCKGVILWQLRLNWIGVAAVSSVPFCPQTRSRCLFHACTRIYVFMQCLCWDKELMWPKLSLPRERGEQKRDVPLFPEASYDTTAQVPILTKADGRNTKLSVRAEGQELGCSNIGGSSVEV